VLTLGSNGVSRQLISQRRGVVSLMLTVSKVGRKERKGGGGGRLRGKALKILKRLRHEKTGIGSRNPPPHPPNPPPTPKTTKKFAGRGRRKKNKPLDDSSRTGKCG